MPKRVLFPVIFFVFFISTFQVSGQVPERTLDFSIGIGKVIRNHPDFPEVNHPAINCYLGYSNHWNGQKPWHRYYNYPRMGINVNGGSTGNTDVLGYYAGIMSEMTFEKRISSKFFWAPRLALGIAWFSDPYNEESNPGNVMIGSDITFFAAGEILAGMRLSSRTDVFVKGGVQHASNSHFTLPNVGMNLPVISIGARWHLVPASPEPVARDTIKPGYDHSIRPHIRVALGINENGSSTGPVNGPKYPIYLASVYVSKLFSPINKVTAGLEAWYNKGSYDFIISQEFYDKNEQAKSCVAAFVLGHEFLMGHFGLLTAGGIYIYNPFYKDKLEANDIHGTKDKLKSIFPARIGVQYYLKNTFLNSRNNLFAGVYVKTNFGQADFLEMGVGYNF